MKNTLLGGSVVLVMAGFFGKALGALYRIPLSNILGAEGIGLYQMVFSVFSLALIVCSGGVTSAVSQRVASIRAGGAGSETKVFLSGFLFSVLASSFFALIFFFFGNDLAFLQGVQEAGIVYPFCGVALIYASALSSFRGLYQGRQNMVPSALSQTIEQSLKLVMGLGFSYFFVQKSLSLGVLGAFLGIILAEFFAFLYLTFRTRKTNFSVATSSSSGFLKANFLACSSALVVPLNSAFDSFVVVNILSTFIPSALATAQFGIQSGIVSSLVNFPVVVSIALSTALLPALSFSLSKNNLKTASVSFEKMLVFSMAFLIPTAMFFAFFARDIFLILYPALSDELVNLATFLLAFSSIEIVLIGIVHLAQSVFQSVGKWGTPSLVMGLSGALRAILTVVLVSFGGVGIFGVTISTILFYGLVALTLVFLMQKFLPFKLNGIVALNGFGLFLILGLSFFVINVYFISSWVKILLAVVVALLFYVLPLFVGNFLGVKDFAFKILKGKKR